MSNGNKRYLGDVFLNAENYERQKQFLKDIIESYQYKYGGSFDAATLQGKVPGDFATKEQGEKADKALLEPIFLGQKRIENISDRQYIYTDATKLDRESDLIDAITWFENLENDDLTEALKSIYDNVISLTNDLYEKKLDKTTYNDFFANDYSPLKALITRTFQTVIDWNGDEITVLNADLVNGLRFILITQEAYDELPTEKKTFWRNVFIIKDSSEIPADYNSPFSLDLTDGYDFRVFGGKLQVSSVVSDNWKDVCSLEDLLSGTDIDGLIKTFIEEEEYVIETESLKNSLKEVPVADIDSNWDQYPFLSSSLHNDFIKNVTIDGKLSGITYNTDSGTDFTTVNLSLGSHMEGYLAPVQNTLTECKNNLKTVSDNVDFLLTENSSLKASVSSITEKNTTQDSRLGSIERTLQTIDGRIQALDRTANSISDSLENIKNKSKWVPYAETEGANLDSRWASDGYIHLWVNEFLGLGLIKLVYHFSQDASDWTLLPSTITKTTKTGSSGEKFDVYTSSGVWAPLPDKYKPIWEMYLPTNSPKFQVKIVDDDDDVVKNRSKLMFKSSMGATTTKQAKTGMAMGFYRFRQV